AKCSQAYPNLRENLNLLFARLEAAPTNVKTKDPRSGLEVELRITRDVFAAGIFYMLYTSDFSRHIPLVVGNAVRGNYRTFLAVAVPLSSALMSQVSLGMYHSVVCAEDVPRIKQSEIERESRNTFLGGKNIRNSIGICKAWVRGRVPAGFFKPVTSKSPVLIISGDVDPVVPPRWGANIARTLPNSRHITIPGVAHGPSFPGCVQDLVTRFVNEASGADLDLTCVNAIRRSDFTLPPPTAPAQSPANSQ
ncbi:MAG TPA: alpha/beta hydrolase, partial [Pyrinomonadaceae bacterium]